MITIPQTDSNLNIGRVGGALGLAIETAAGTANTTPDVYLSLSENTLRGHMEPLEDISSRNSRIMDTNSVIGRRWTEGDIGMYTDVVNSGWLWKMALGNELLVTGTPDNHTFYPTVSGNTPLTATLTHQRGDVDTEQYTYATIDELNFEVSDGIAMISASLFAQYPTSTSMSGVTTTSGTIVAFNDYFVQFGGTLTTAAAASTTPLSEFNLTIANNAEVIHRSGTANVSAIRTKGLRISGNYKLFFDSVTDRDAYYELNKRAMIVTFSGYNNESLRFRIPRFRINEAEIDSGLDDFYALTADFVGEDWVDTGTATRLIDVRLQNDRSSVYA